MHCLMVPLSSYPRQLFITEHIDEPVIAIQRFHFNQCIAFFLNTADNSCVLSFRIILHDGKSLLRLFIR